MATYSTTIKRRNEVNNGWDEILPVTIASNVKCSDGNSVETQLADIANVILATGIGTAITLDMPSVAAYNTNMKLTFIASAANSGSATTININDLGAINLYKPNTATAPNLKNGKPYTVWYNGTSFFLQASAEGDALAEHVLAGKTFSNDDDTELVGTMTNHGAKIYTPSASNQTLGAGYVSSLTVNGDADLISTNIKSGKTIFGVAGNSNVVDTSAGDAAASQILSGKKAFVDGALVTGTIPSKGVATITPSTVNQTIASGQYLSGTQTISGDADLISANIKAGKNIFGVAGNSNVVDTSSANGNASAFLSGYTGYVDGVKVTGTMANYYNTDNIVATTDVSGNTLKMNIPNTGRYRAGYHLQATDNDWVESNIKSGVNVFGKVGSFSNIKSIQRGTAVIPSANRYIYVPISAVDTNKSIILLGHTGDLHDMYTDCIAPSIFNSTSFRLQEGYSGTGTVGDQTINWQVIEFNNVKSKQSGVKTISSSQSTYSTISAVVPEKCILVSYATASVFFPPSGGINIPGCVLTNATRLDFSFIKPDYTLLSYWQLIEFK